MSAAQQVLEGEVIRTKLPRPASIGSVYIIFTSIYLREV